MSTADNLTANANKVAYTDYYDIDRIIFSDTQTFSVVNQTGYGDQVFGFSLSFLYEQYLYPIGIFSTDGGTTWNDIAASDPSGSLTNPVSLPAVTVNAWTSHFGQCNLHVNVNSKIGTGSTFSLIVSVALLLTDSPSSASPPTPASNTTKTTRTTTTPSGSQVDYRRIVGSDTVGPTAGVGEAITSFSHGLGYVPDLFFWMNKGYSQAAGVSAGWYSAVQTSYDIKNNQGLSEPLMFMDDSKIYYADTFGGGAQNYMYRLYKP